MCAVTAAVCCALLPGITYFVAPTRSLVKAGDSSRADKPYRSQVVGGSHFIGI